MPLYHKSWYKKLFKPKNHAKKKIDALKDITAVKEYLQEMNRDVKDLLTHLDKLEDLEHESKVAKSELLHINTETQGEILDKLLQEYEFFQNDVDINGERMKLIAKNILRRAKRLGMHDFVKERQDKPQWKLFW